ncbi:hypothetical protein KC851_02765 [Candidatus Kaiserbacteria bacterium]|nr:hypothetical protein [Candidatus Kaiserbacteria bacterium]
MGKLVKNIAVILGFVTIAFGAFYLYQNHFTPLEEAAEMQVLVDNMLNETRVYQLRSATLSKISLDASLFEDELFRSLRSYRTEIEDQPFGRNNPFEAVSESNT